MIGIANCCPVLLYEIIMVVFDPMTAEGRSALRLIRKGRKHSIPPKTFKKTITVVEWLTTKLELIDPY